MPAAAGRQSRTRRPRADELVPLWLLGALEGCAEGSRRSLAKLLGIRGRAAVRWQAKQSGATGRIAVGPGRAGRVTESLDEDEEEDDVVANGATPNRRNSLPTRGRGDELGSVARTA